MIKWNISVHKYEWTKKYGENVQNKSVKYVSVSSIIANFRELVIAHAIKFTYL